MWKKSFLGILLSTLILLTACQVENKSNSQNTQTANKIKEESNQTNKMSNIQTAPPKAGDTIATIETDKGNIKLKLFTIQAPETTKNFIELANSGKYENVLFHRVIENFMIQTGDFTSGDGRGGHSYMGPGTSFADEFSPDLKNLFGAVSMANRGPNTNGSQFFIVTARDGTPWLDNKHSVFGQVYEGIDVAETISRLPRNQNDAPLEPVKIKKISISTF